jgi:hypothetical protein
MLKSRFHFFSFITIFLLVLSCVGLYKFSQLVFSDTEIPVEAWIFFVLAIYLIVWVGYGELRTKALHIAFEDKTIYIRRFYGLGRSMYFDLADFDGYSTSILRSRGRYEYLYLKLGKKKVIKLSEFYHWNYLALKEHIAQHIAYLGYEEFSLKTEIKEIFS